MAGSPRRGDRTGPNAAVSAKRPYLVEREKTVKIGANLNEDEAKALKARLEAQLANTCGGEWCVDVYRSRGRWLARAYRRGERTRGPKPGTKYRQRMKRKLDCPYI